MAQATLTIDLDAIAANWRALNAASASDVETAAVVKADAYGLGATVVAKALARHGARTFFVAMAEEGIAVRQALGPVARIFVFGGHMAGDADILQQNDLMPLLNSIEQIARHRQTLPGHHFGVQLDSGMNRLGIKERDWRDAAASVLAEGPELLMSHLACADDAENPMNAAQLVNFQRMTNGCGVARSLAATDGTALGPDYHFDLTRPGIGLYGGTIAPGLGPVVRLSLPVIQTHDLAPGEKVGYGGGWQALEPARIATLSAGYADGLIRAMGGNIKVFQRDTACPVVGRISMDLLTVDVSHLRHPPETLDILCPAQGVDTLARTAGTIPYEILTSLGPRYARHYTGAAA
jgi:alanine racemase